MVYHEIMLAKFLVIVGSLSAVTLFVVLQLTTPASIHPVGLLGVFILIYAVSTVLSTAVVYVGSRILGRLLVMLRATRRAQTSTTVQRSYLYGTVLAFAPVVMIGMKSVSSLGFVDVLLVIAFEVIGCFYLWRRQ